ncbi:MAG: hypothetical protein R2755_23785 [Acidimicrobiales bacterium]
MARLTIGDVPDDVHDVLTERAARLGLSLESYVRTMLIDLAQRPDPPAPTARSDRAVPAGATLDAATILALRDADRR